MWIQPKAYYTAKRRRLFGPFDVSPVQITVVEILPGDFLLCTKLLQTTAWQGRGMYAFLKTCSDVTVCVKLTRSLKLPDWLRVSSPLEILAGAADK